MPEPIVLLLLPPRGGENRPRAGRDNSTPTAVTVTEGVCKICGDGVSLIRERWALRPLQGSLAIGLTVVRMVGLSEVRVMV